MPVAPLDMCEILLNCGYNFLYRSVPSMSTMKDFF